jgi:hypothetical protein
MAFFAILSIAMAIASYLFVLLLAVACVWVPWWTLTNTHSLSVHLVVLLLFGIAVAGAMIWSLVPRFVAVRPDGVAAPRRPGA